MKNILFLTDFSKSSINAINFGCSLFSKQKNKFHLLHICKPNSISLYTIASSKSIHTSLFNDKKNKIEALKTALDNKFTINIKTSVSFNNFIPAIKNYISKNNIDILIAGFDGANSLEEKLFGSNTLKIIRSIKIDFLIVPKTIQSYEVNNILCLLDHNDDLASVIKKNLLKHTNKTFIRVSNNTMSYRDQEILEQNDVQNYTYKKISKIPLEYVKSYILQTQKIDLTLCKSKENSLFNTLIFNNFKNKIVKNLIKPIYICA